MKLESNFEGNDVLGERFGLDRDSFRTSAQYLLHKRLVTITPRSHALSQRRRMIAGKRYAHSRSGLGAKTILPWNTSFKYRHVTFIQGRMFNPCRIRSPQNPSWSALHSHSSLYCEGIIRSVLAYSRSQHLVQPSSHTVV